MRRTTRAALESLRRSKEVAMKYRPNPDRSGFMTHLSGLDSSLTTATTAAARARPEVVQQETAARQDATAVLYEELRALRDIARVSPPADVPGFAKLFTLPRQHGKREALVAAARQMLQEATAYEALFVGHGRPVDFLARITAAIAKVEQTTASHGAALAAKRSAVVTLNTAVRQGRQHVNALGVMLRSLYPNDSAILASWREIKRLLGIERKRSATTEQDPSASTTPIVDPHATSSMMS